MQVLIDDLLLYSRIGRAGEDAEKIDLNDIVEDVGQILGEAIRESGATVSVADLPVVAGFRTDLTRLFQNLIGNAIKFRSDAPLKIDVRSKRADGAWIITVSDNGIGVAPEFHEKIFGVFQRLHTRDKYDGTGIGLAICEKVVDRMGGRISVEGNAEGGCSFKFSIPD